MAVAFAVSFTRGGNGRDQMEEGLMKTEPGLPFTPCCFRVTDTEDKVFDAVFL